MEQPTNPPAATTDRRALYRARVGALDLTTDECLTFAAELLLYVADQWQNTYEEAAIRAMSTDVWMLTEEGRAEVAADAEDPSFSSLTHVPIECAYCGQPIGDDPRALLCPDGRAFMHRRCADATVST